MLANLCHYKWRMLRLDSEMTDDCEHHRICGAVASMFWRMIFDQRERRSRSLGSGLRLRSLRAWTIWWDMGWTSIVTRETLLSLSETMAESPETQHPVAR